MPQIMENLKPIFRIFFSFSHSTPRRLRCHSFSGVLLLTERMNVRACNLYARFAPLFRNMKLAIWTFPYCKESLCDWIWSTWAEFICHIRSHHAKNNDKNFTRAFFSRSNFKPYNAPLSPNRLISGKTIKQHLLTAIIFVRQKWTWILRLGIDLQSIIQIVVKCWSMIFTATSTV